MKPDCAVDDTHSSCKDEDSDGGKFVAEITNKSHTSSPAFTVFPDPTVTSKGKFLVDNKCNSGVELMNEVTVVDLRPGGTLPIKLIKLDHLKLRVNKCKSNFHVSVKVWVGDGLGLGNNFATVYLPGDPTYPPDAGATLHVHEANAEFFAFGDTTAAFTLNIGDIEYTAAP